MHEMRKYMNILEARSAPLYHILWTAKAYDIFTNDHMPARWKHDIPGLGERLGNSFSRNATMKFGRPDFAASSTPIRLVMNQDKLAQSYKIIPLDAEHVMNHTYGSNRQSIGFKDRRFHADDSGQYAEEFVIGDIKALHRFIAKIEFITQPYRNTEKLLELVTAYSEKFNIALWVNPTIKQAIVDRQAAWDHHDDDWGKWS